MYLKECFKKSDEEKNHHHHHHHLHLHLHQALLIAYPVHPVHSIHKTWDSIAHAAPGTYLARAPISIYLCTH